MSTFDRLFRLTRAVVTLATLSASPAALAGVSIRVDEESGRYTFLDETRPVLTYNFKTVPVPAGVTGKFAVPRSDYVHPLYGPDGEVLTMDFSPDHPHHRGIYWAWPEVTYKGEKRDIHALQGLFSRPVKIVRQEQDEQSAVLKAENLWKWGDKEPIVREFVTIKVHAAAEGLQAIDFTLRFEAQVEGVTIARRDKNHYGGFNFRMSGRTGQQITTHTDAADVKGSRMAWAELRGVAPNGKQPVGAFLLQHPENPEYPGDWQEYAKLNWLQPTFPAPGKAYLLKKETPLELRFRVIVRSGKGLDADPKLLFDAYVADTSDPLPAMRAYQFGDARTVLMGEEEAVRDFSAEGRKAFEARLLATLAQGEASVDFQRWVCGQFVQVGSDACVTAVVPMLQGDAWQPACEVLLTLNTPMAKQALVQAAKSLSAPERVATVLHALGQGRDASQIAIFTEFSSHEDTSVARAAMQALGRIGTVESGAALLALNVSESNRLEYADALLRCANQLSDATEAKKLFRAVSNMPPALAAQRAAAMIGMARTSPADAKQDVLTALSGDDAIMKRSASTALLAFDQPSLISLRDTFAEVDLSTKIMLLGAWGTRSVEAAEPEMIASIRDDDEALRKAAITAMANIKGSAAGVEALLACAAGGGAAGRAASETLPILRGEWVAASLAAAVVSDDEETANAAIKAVIRRKDTGYLGVLLKVADMGSARSVRQVASCLRRDGGTAELPALHKALINRNDSGVKTAVARAMVGICKQQGSGYDISTFLDPPIDAPSRDALLQALPEIGGEKALAFVCKERNEAMVRTLHNWPDAAALAPLQSILEDPKAADLNHLAAAALLKVATTYAPKEQQPTILSLAEVHVKDVNQRAQYSKSLSELKVSKEAAE